MIVEGRFILTDGILHCFVCLAVMATAVVRTQEPRGLGWWLAIVFNGFVVGCAVSSKLTSLSVLVFIAIVHLTQLFAVHKLQREFWLLTVTKGCVLAFVAILVFFGAFTAHLICQPFHGGGEEFVSLQFRKSLLDSNAPNANWRVRTVNQSLLWNIVSLNADMHSVNMRISASHPHGSAWSSWPFLTGKWILFWTD
jgi:dolichyl-phosphate-mannose--protein O-mannosyl transferase